MKIFCASLKKRNLLTLRFGLLIPPIKHGWVGQNLGPGAFIPRDIWPMVELMVFDFRVCGMKFCWLLYGDFYVSCAPILKSYCLRMILLRIASRRSCDNSWNQPIKPSILSLHTLCIYTYISSQFAKTCNMLCSSTPRRTIKVAYVPDENEKKITKRFLTTSTMTPCLQ